MVLGTVYLLLFLLLIVVVDLVIVDVAVLVLVIQSLSTEYVRINVVCMYTKLVEFTMCPQNWWNFH